MATISTSLKQRGQEILGLGRPPQGSPAPPPGEGTGGSPPNPAPHPISEREIEAMLDTEASTATGSDTAGPRDLPAGSPGLSLPATEWVAPVRPSVPRPISTTPTSALVEGPVTPTASPALAAAPPQPATTAPAPTAAVGSESGAKSPSAPIEIPGGPGQVVLSPEQEAELLEREDIQERFVRLDKAIDALYQRILGDNVSVNKDITDWCHNRLAAARMIVTYRRVGQLARAEWLMEQVRARLDRAEESGRETRWQIGIMLWGILWFAIFIYLIFHPLRLENFNDLFINPAVFSRALFFGGIGGVAGIFYHLFKYVRDRSFDSKYVLSYFGKPFMGMIMGSMIYLTVFVAMRVLGLTPIGLTGDNADSVANVLYSALLFFVAMAAGFKENLAFNLLNRVIKAVLGDDNKAGDPQPDGI